MKAHSGEKCQIEDFEMIKLEDVHEAMNDQHVQEAARDLHFEYVLHELDYVEDDLIGLRPWTIAMFKRYGVHPTEEQLLAAEQLLLGKIERGQAWTQ
jgi:hypothetical protein